MDSLPQVRGLARGMLSAHQENIPVNSDPNLEDRNARLVRNLLAMRMVLAMDQMQTGRWGDRIEEIDEELASLGHDMKSTAACAADGLRRTFLLPRLVNRRNRSGHRPARATPRD
jgi:hypothetical protein